MSTNNMVTDFYTKPLQGELFRFMRDKLNYEKINGEFIDFC